MTGPTLEVRAAESTPEEGRLFAGYLDQAAEGFMRFLLGRRAVEIVAEAYTQAKNEYSFENVIVAEQDGRPVGMASGFTGKRRRGFSERPLRGAAGFPTFRYHLLGLLLAPLFRKLSKVEDEEFYLLCIAVDPDARGRGIGSVLLDAVEDQANAKGSSRLSLDVAASNDGARRLYERRGMTVGPVWPRLPLVRPVFVRMAKRL